jgi:hypothetical protein
MGNTCDGGQTAGRPGKCDAPAAARQQLRGSHRAGVRVGTSLLGAAGTRARHIVNTSPVPNFNLTFCIYNFFLLFFFATTLQGATVQKEDCQLWYN